MSWGSRYVDTVITEPVLELVRGHRLSDGEIKEFPAEDLTIGGFGRAAASQIAIWRRLMRSSLSLEPVELWFDCEPEFLAGVLPRSLHDSAYLAGVGKWPALRLLDADSSFAIVRNGNGNRLAFQGLPTEEGLDLLTEFIAR